MPNNRIKMFILFSPLIWPLLIHKLIFTEACPLYTLISSTRLLSILEYTTYLYGFHFHVKDFFFDGENMTICSQVVLARAQ